MPVKILGLLTDAEWKGESWSNAYLREKVRRKQRFAWRLEREIALEKALRRLQLLASS